MEAFESLLSDGPHVQAVLFEGIVKFSEKKGLLKGDMEQGQVENG